MKFVRLSALTCVGALAGALAALPVAAQSVFKWVDAQGRVTYSNTPPPSEARVRSSTEIAIPPGPDAREVAAAEEARYWRERRLREELREAEASRSRRDLADTQAAEARQRMALAAREDERRSRELALVEQCQRERRVDCLGGGAVATYGYGTPVIINRRPQPIWRAAPFPVNPPAIVVQPGIQPGTIAGTQALLAPHGRVRFGPPGYSTLR
jgi:hypothetical protein